jgi:hypothetical protein
VPHSVEGPFNWLRAAAEATVDDAQKMPRRGGFIARPKGPADRGADYRFAPASPRVMVDDAVDEGSLAPQLHCFLKRMQGTGKAAF